MNIVNHTDSIWVIKNFLDIEECKELIRLSERIGYTEAEVSLPQGAKMMKGLRNNSRLLYKNEELAASYWARLKEYCPPELDGQKAIGLNEEFRFYKYETSQRFKKHIDGRFRRNEHEQSRITFMIYLNDDYEGGETSFGEIVIQPETGTALCFIHEQKHEGCPVTSGIKYAIRSDVMYKNFK